MSEPVVTKGVHRGVLGLDRRGWPGAIAVALVAAFVAVGLPLLNSVVSAEQPLSPGTVVEVGRGVSFTTAGDWSRDAEETSALRDRAFLSQDALSFLVEAEASERTLTEEYDRLAAEIRDGSGAQLFNDAGAITTDSGLTGIGGSYGSPESEGRFAVFRSGGTSVRVLAKGPPDAMASGLDDVVAMVLALRVGPS